MREKDPTGVTALEEKHMIAMLVFLAANGPSRKIDIYAVDKTIRSAPRT